ncbi:MAG: thiamine pyrophosphate-dependent enzyme, partial [Desulfuromonadales bacterium]
LPREVQQQIIDKKLDFYVIDGVRLGNEIGLGPRINVIMQTAFFKISGIISFEAADKEIRDAIVKSYGKAGEKVVNMNFRAVEAGAKNIEKVDVPATADSAITMKDGLGAEVPDFVRNTLGPIIDGLGDSVPVSAMPADGTFPTGTAKYEKRNIAVNIPVWDEDLCIQCGICSFVCPHATIRMKIYDADQVKRAPENFKSVEAKGKDLAGKKFTLQVAPEDCTGCGACVYNCPAKSKEDPEHKAINMQLQAPLREQEEKSWDFFLSLPDTDAALFNRASLKGSQLLPPMFEFSGACAGCGETPFVKLCSQLFGDRMLVANATGCSSIYGGNLPTTPWSTRKDGLGPAWSNSLFEDNAEFGYGFRLAVDKFAAYAQEMLGRIMAGADAGHQSLMKEIFFADQSTQEKIEAQRSRVSELKALLEKHSDPEAKQLLSVADYLVKKSVWIHGGDGWAYDIGYGGLDHVLASGENVNVLVLDTEVYSNTGGQASKSTPLGAVAQFAAGGKQMPKKDLGMIAMTYGNIYVAKVNLSNPAQAVKAMLEADSYDGPSLIIAYTHCIAHGINMASAVESCRQAVASGHWPLFRYDPRLAAQGKNPLQLDSKEPTMSFEEYAKQQNRYRVLKKVAPDAADGLMAAANKETATRYDLYRKLAEMQADCGKK